MSRYFFYAPCSIDIPEQPIARWANFLHVVLPADTVTLWIPGSVPALDAFRNFCISPQTALEATVSDIKRLSVV